MVRKEILGSKNIISANIYLRFLFWLFFSISDQKPLSVEVGKASMLRLLGAEQENAELKRLLEELQAQQEVSALMSP